MCTFVGMPSEFFFILNRKKMINAGSKIQNNPFVCYFVLLEGNMNDLKVNRSIQVDFLPSCFALYCLFSYLL